MRIGCPGLAIFLATAACGASSAASVTVRCGPAGARTLAADPRGRIYLEGQDVYGCVGGGPRSYELGTRSRSPGQARVGPVALAGIDAAYGLTRGGVDTVSAGVIVRRLDNGRTLHVFSATTGPLGPEFLQSVEAVVVKPDGAVAWIGDGGSIVRHANTEEVDRFDRRGEARLDRSVGFDLRSLRLRGSQLSWRHGNATRTATLL